MEWNGQGLTEQEVAQRVAAGQINVNVDVKTKSIKRILVENIFSLFNLINFMLAAVLLVVGSYKNMLFMGVIICNTLIGIIQEIRSKRAVDRLSIVVLERTEVLRGREFVELPIEDIVLDDIIRLGRGAQIPSDAEVVSGECMVNESLLTGESDLIRKRVGDTLMSGSFITGGECIARVIHVGKDNYASQINSSAKYIKQVKSEMMTTFNRIIQFVSIIIFPLGAILFWNQYTAEGATASSAIVNTVAALIGMIPEGLILLTSTVLAVSVIRLSQNKVLVQHLYCIETLARVDVLCL
ncbi:MAG: HAD-IC family P-type ATPase, partial [Clostridiales bacterium]|nr:HAD-IC family P-type ATPase [Clostridiales bacterium]